MMLGFVRFCRILQDLIAIDLFLQKLGSIADHGERVCRAGEHRQAVPRPSAGLVDIDVLPKKRPPLGRVQR